VKGHEEDTEETLHALRDINSRTGARGDPMAVPADLPPPPRDNVETDGRP
jgi:hypothetical protein